MYSETYSETAAQAYQKLRNQRDRALGALFVLVHDGVISNGRMRELLDMDIYQQREELDRLMDIGSGS